MFYENPHLFYEGMATFKAEVYAHQKKRDGTYNIKIRVTQGRRKRYLATPWYVTKDDVTRNMKIKNQKYIDLTNSLIAQYRDICDRIGMALMDMDVDQVVDLIQRSKDEGRFDLDIVGYTREYADSLRQKGHDGTAKSYTVMASSLVRYVGREKISIFEITVRFLQDWTKWIGANAQFGKSGESSMHEYPTLLRAMYRRAKREFNDEDAGIIRIPNSPFSHFDIPRLPVFRKRALTAEQIRMIISFPYSTDRRGSGQNNFNLAKDVFIISFGLMGMNPVDLYYCTDYANGRITYQRTKTRTRRSDKAEISVKVEPEIARLIEKYRDPFGKRVFNFYLHYCNEKVFDYALNRGLGKMDERLGVDNLQFYAARHSWATIAVNDVGVDKYTVHQALNHVDETMRITDIYIRKSYDGNDKANRAVLDLIFQK